MFGSLSGNFVTVWPNRFDLVVRGITLLTVSVDAKLAITTEPNDLEPWGL